MRKPTLLTLFLIVFIDLIGFGLIMPLLPYFARDFGASGAEVGALFGVYSLMQFFFAPFWGRLSDRIGRRPILLVSLAGSTLSYVLLGLSHSYWAVFASRALAGLCAANISVANAYVADITTKENRSKGMGVIGAAFGLGFILGPALAGLSGSHGHSLPSFLAAGISGLSLALAVVFLPESRKPGASEEHGARKGRFEGWGQTLSRPMIGGLVLISFLVSVAFSKWEATFALFLQGDIHFHYTVRTVGWLLAYLGILTAMLQGGLLGRLVKRFGEPVLLKVGLGALASGLFLLPFSATFGELFGCLTLLGIGLGTLRPVLFGTASILTGADGQGLVLGVLEGAGSLGRIAGPLLGGWLLDHSLAWPFWSGTLVVLLALALTPPGKSVLEAKAASAA